MQLSLRVFTLSVSIFIALAVAYVELAAAWLAVCPLQDTELLEAVQ